MSFLSPWIIALAGGLTIPPLVALYFLKLKRTVRPVPTTLLWKRTVEDMHVNSPFQKLRSSLLLLLQLLLLLLAAFALGKPMLEAATSTESSVIIMIDRSASMAVEETDDRTRLDIAKEEAKKILTRMPGNARAMVISFSDRAEVVSSFDSNKNKLERLIDDIKPTQSSTRLAEAVNLAEAFASQVIIRGEEASRAPQAPTSVFLFSDGRIEDTDFVALRKLNVGGANDASTSENAEMKIFSVGKRSDNVGILSLDARRHYDHPERLEVAATVRNFGPREISFDASLYINDQNVAIQQVTLTPGLPEDPEAPIRLNEPPPGSLAVLAFGDDPEGIGDYIEFEGGGEVEIRLRVEDALSADDRAWTIIDEPRNVDVLLVTPGNIFLENVLKSLPVTLNVVSGAAYEAMPDDELLEDGRSKYDVVIIDGYETKRLPRGNYMFWGAAPPLDGIKVGGVIRDQDIFTWDETHPLLRYVQPAAMLIYQWLDMELPKDAVVVMEGETSPLIADLQRDGSRFVICAFPLIVNDGGVQRMNTENWVTQVDFVTFMQNAVQYLASNIATAGEQSVRPGQPVSMPIPEDVEHVTLIRPDHSTTRIPTGGQGMTHIGDTRQVGVYRVEPAIKGEDRFTVNLFNPTESLVLPNTAPRLGQQTVAASTETVQSNRPAWTYFLIAFLVFLLFEWVVYNLRVFV